MGGGGCASDPGDFSLWALLVIVVALFLVLREFAAHRVDPAIPPVVVALLTAVVITSMMGLLSVFTGWGEITGAAVAALVVACGFLIVGYLCAIERFALVISACLPRSGTSPSWAPCWSGT